MRLHETHRTDGQHQHEYGTHIIFQNKPQIFLIIRLVF